MSLKFAWGFWFLMALTATIDAALVSVDSVEDNFGIFLTYQVAQVVVFPLVILGWFTADAREQGHSPTLLFRVFVLLLAAIAVPIYLLRVKGTKRAMVSFASFLLMFVLVFVYSMSLSFLVS